MPPKAVSNFEFQMSSRYISNQENYFEQWITRKSEDNLNLQKVYTSTELVRGPGRPFVTMAPPSCCHHVRLHNDLLPPLLCVEEPEVPRHGVIGDPEETC